MIKKEQVKHIAKLARLQLSERELQKYQKELSKILDYIQKLKEVKVTEVEPMTHPFLQKNVWREDEMIRVQPINLKLLELAPETKDRYFKVKKII